MIQQEEQKIALRDFDITKERDRLETLKSQRKQMTKLFEKIDATTNQAIEEKEREQQTEIEACLKKESLKLAKETEVIVKKKQIVTNEIKRLKATAEQKTLAPMPEGLKAYKAEKEKETVNKLARLEQDEVTKRIAKAETETEKESQLVNLQKQTEEEEKSIADLQTQLKELSM